MSGVVLGARRAVRTDAYLTDPRFLRAPHLEEWARAESTQAMIGAPVFDRDGQVIALLWAYNRSATLFTAGDESVISGLAQQAALAIGTARGMEGERHRARQTAALLEIAQVCASTLELRPLLRAVALQVARALAAERCTINFWRGAVLVPVMSQFADGHVDATLWERYKEMGKDGVDAIPADLGAVKTRRPVMVEDMDTSDLVAPAWVKAFGIRTLLVVPLISGDRVIGTLALDDTRGPRAWTAADQDLATTMAAQVALAVDRARQYEEAAQRASEVQTLSAVGETLASTLDLQEVLDAIADSAIKVTGAQRAVVFEMDQAAGHLLARAVRGMAVDKGYVVHLGQGAAGTAVAQRAPVWSPDVVAEPPPGYDSMQVQAGMTLAEMATRFGYRAVLAVPVVSRDAVLGAVCIYWDEVHRPDEREIRLLSALARQAAIAMENARLVSDLRRTLDDLKAAQDTLVRGATLRAVGELAAGASHHLNNLMAVVLGRTQLLLMKKPPDAMMASLKTIERAAVDAAETVRRIQAFGRTDTSDAVVAFDLNGTVREGIQLTRPRWEHEAQVRGARVEVIYDPVTLPARPRARRRDPGSGHQPHPQRGGRHAFGRAHGDPRTGGQGPSPRLGKRLGYGHVRGGEATGLRALLHHQGREEHRPGPGGGVRHHPASRRRDLHGEHGGDRHHGDLLAAHRGKRGGRGRAPLGATARAQGQDPRHRRRGVRPGDRRRGALRARPCRHGGARRARGPAVVLLGRLRPRDDRPRACPT